MMAEVEIGLADAWRLIQRLNFTPRALTAWTAATSAARRRLVELSVVVCPASPVPFQLAMKPERPAAAAWSTSRAMVLVSSWLKSVAGVSVSWLPGYAETGEQPF